MQNNTNYSKTIERKKYLDEMKPLLKKEVEKEADGKTFFVKFNSKGNKHLYSDTFNRAKALDKEDLKHLDVALQNASFVTSASISKPRKDDITKFYYFKDNKNELYYNVAEDVKSGKVHRFLYSVTSTIK
jgi:hypothetical protein